MTPTPTSNDPRPSSTLWLRAWLVAALVWAALVRVPLILNAADHLNSDLAVDGLTLREAVHGHWRWHYPGTPHMGVLPVALSWPLAIAWGPNPITLVAAGTIAWLLLMVACFLLALRAFGPTVAAWGLLPLTCASTGAIWLSGWVTGGHLLSAAWHAGAFGLLHACLARGGWRCVVVLGLWCGLGVYHDLLFLATLIGLGPGALSGWWASGRSGRGFVCGLLFIPAFVAGAWPREVGARVDPYNAYPDQLRPIFDRDAIAGHGRIFALECLPRLIAGHRLPGLQTDPDPRARTGPVPLRSKPEPSLLALANTVVGLALFSAALAALARAGLDPSDPARAAVCRGLLISAAALSAGFVLNRNIFDSDNDRYLVSLLVPWSLGFGLTLRTWSRRGRSGFAASVACALVLASLMTLDSARWYARFGWIDTRGRPVRRPLEDPALDWLNAHREATQLVGGYWDVYRLSFLTGGRVQGIPFPGYPNRFPEWTIRPSRVLIVRPTPEGDSYRESALRSGGRVLHETPGLMMISWP